MPKLIAISLIAIASATASYATHAPNSKSEEATQPVLKKLCDTSGYEEGSCADV